MKNYDLNTMNEFVNEAYHSTMAITGGYEGDENNPPSTDINLIISGYALSIPNNRETFEIVKGFVETLISYKEQKEKEYPFTLLDRYKNSWYEIQSSKTQIKYYVSYDIGRDAALIFEEVDDIQYDYIDYFQIGGQEHFGFPDNKDRYKTELFNDIVDIIREYERGIM